MAILVLAEHDNTTLAEATARTLAAAAKIGGDIDLLIAGKDCHGVAAQAAQLDGLRRVRLAEAEPLRHGLAEPLADLMVALAPDYDVLMAPASAIGKSALPRVAALLDVMQISDVIAVEAPDIFKRPIYAGNAIATVRTSDAKTVLTVRPTSFAPVGMGGPVPVEPVDLPDLKTPTRFVSEELTGGDRPDLGAAKIVVAGGRALGSKENFETLIGGLAEKLGAAIGASRVAVDSGFVTNDHQIGQTGRIVAPDLYVACGISGAVQHLAGMTQSRIVVAINADPEAPIFAVADYGLVADIFQALPELIEKL